MSYKTYEVRVYDDGDKYWYLNGKDLSEEKFNSRNQSLGGKVVTIDGKQYILTEVIDV